MGTKYQKVHFRNQPSDPSQSKTAGISRSHCTTMMIVTSEHRIEWSLLSTRGCHTHAKTSCMGRRRRKSLPMQTRLCIPFRSFPFLHLSKERNAGTPPPSGEFLLQARNNCSFGHLGWNSFWRKGKETKEFLGGNGLIPIIGLRR